MKMNICNKPRWRISSLRIFAAVFWSSNAAMIMAVAFLVHPVLAILLAFIAGWFARSSQIYYEPTADPLSQIDRKNNARN